MKKSILSKIFTAGMLALLIGLSACGGSSEFDAGDSEEAAEALFGSGGSDSGSSDNFWATGLAAGNEDANGNGYVNVGGEIVGYGPDL